MGLWGGWARLVRVALHYLTLRSFCRELCCKFDIPLMSFVCGYLLFLISERRWKTWHPAGIHVTLSPKLQFSKLAGATTGCWFLLGGITLEEDWGTLPTRFRCLFMFGFKNSRLWREHVVDAASFQCLVLFFSEFPLTYSSFISFLPRSLFPLFSSGHCSVLDWTGSLSLAVSLAMLFLSLAPCLFYLCQPFAIWPTWPLSFFLDTHLLKAPSLQNG